MAVRDWLTRKASKTIEAAVEPTKKAIQNTIAQKSDVGSKLLRLGLLAFLTLVAFRDDVDNRSPKERAERALPNIVINNYVNDISAKGAKRNDSEH